MNAVDKLKSRAVVLRGKAKVLVGRATGNSKLQTEGRVDQASGRIRRVLTRLGPAMAKVRRGQIRPRS